MTSSPRKTALAAALALMFATACSNSKKDLSQQPAPAAPAATTAATTPAQSGAPLAQPAPGSPSNAANGQQPNGPGLSTEIGKVAPPNPNPGGTAASPAPKAAQPNPVVPPPQGVTKPTASLKVPTAQKKPLSASKTAFFTEQNWLVTLAAGSEAGLFDKHYKDRWLQFKSDQTFQILNNATPTHTGRWAYDEANDILFLSTADPYFNNSWKCQNFKKNLLLLGNTELNATGIQIRLFMTEKKPGEVHSDGN